jgi:hypothetical protein
MLKRGTVKAGRERGGQREDKRGEEESRRPFGVTRIGCWAPAARLKSIGEERVGAIGTAEVAADEEEDQHEKEDKLCEHNHRSSWDLQNVRHGAPSPPHNEAWEILILVAEEVLQLRNLSQTKGAVSQSQDMLFTISKDGCSKCFNSLMSLSSSSSLPLKMDPHRHPHPHPHEREIKKLALMRIASKASSSSCSGEERRRGEQGIEKELDPSKESILSTRARASTRSWSCWFSTRLMRSVHAVRWAITNASHPRKLEDQTKWGEWERRGEEGRGGKRKGGPDLKDQRNRRENFEPKENSQTELILGISVKQALANCEYPIPPSEQPARSSVANKKQAIATTFTKASSASFGASLQLIG